MGEENRERIGPGLRLFILLICGLVVFLCFALLVSMALNPKITMAYNTKGATYSGPLTWLGRWLNLGGLSGTGRHALYILLMVLLNLAYFAAAFLARKDRRLSTTVLIVGGFLLFSLLFLFIPPLLSRDVYSYTFYGRAMTVHHANPFLAKVISYPRDVIYPFVGWKETASVYGPLFNYLSFIVCRVAGNNIPANVLGFKVLSFFFYAASLPLVYAVSRRVSPGRENLALVIAAWNPLLLLHLIGGGHNDSVMFFFALLGFYLYRRGYPVWGLVSMVLAVMVKMTAALALLPYLVFFLRDQRGKVVPRVLESAAAVVVIPVLFYFPFWNGFSIFNATGKVLRMSSSSSIPTLAKDVLTKLLSAMGLAKTTAGSLSTSLAHVFFLGLFVAITLALLWKVRDYRSMVLSTAGIFLAWILTASYLLPWYLAMGIMVCAVAGWNATTACTIAASSIFTLYKVPTTPTTHLLLHQGGKAKPLLYLSIPLAIILIAWLILGKPFSGLRWAKPGREIA